MQTKTCHKLKWAGLTYIGWQGISKGGLVAAMFEARGSVESADGA
jgi:hypothetical protein